MSDRCWSWPRRSPTSCWWWTATAPTARAKSPRNTARVILDDGTGKGGAIRQAIREATGDILVFIDGDGSHDPHDIPALIEPIVQGAADHVSGSRMLGGSDELHATFHQFIRLFGSQIITLSINYTQDVRLTDCQNGFRAIRRDVRGHSICGKRSRLSSRRW